MGAPGNFNANRLRGKRAKFAGQNFEQAVMAMAGIQNIAVTQIPSSCRWVSANKAIPMRSPFDLILHFTDEHGDRQSAFVDVKTRDSGAFRYSEVTPHQIHALTRASCGGPAGLLIGYPDAVYFFSVHIVRQLNPRESLDFTDGVLLGSRLSFDLREIFRA